MTDEVMELLLANQSWFTTDKKVWQPEEMKVVYTIFNLASGDSRRDTGCNSCRRAVVTKVKKMFQEYAKGE